MGAHSKHSASGSAQWLTCAPSLAMEELSGIEDKGNDNSRLGTAAHFVGAECLKNDKDAHAYLGFWVGMDEGGNDEFIISDHAKQHRTDTDGLFFYEVDEQMVEALQVYINYIRNLKPVSTFFEEKVDYSHLVKDGFGTSDAIAEVVEMEVDNKTTVNSLYVCDLKYGFGRVDAFENSQGMLYGIGALKSFGFLLQNKIDRVVVVIIQPRIDHISEYTISVEDLIKWGEETVKPGAKLSQGYLDKLDTVAPKDVVIPLADFTPSEKGCKWCKVRGTCKARANVGYEAAVEGFEDLTTEDKLETIDNADISKESFKNPMLMDNAALALNYGKLMLFLGQAESYKDLIVSKIEAGELVPGFKIIETEKARSWTLKDKELIKVIRTAGLQKKDYEKTSIITPTEAEKSLKKLKPKDHTKRYNKLAEAAITRGAGNPKLVVDNTPQLKTEELEKPEEIPNFLN